MALLDSTYDTESGIARFIRRFDMILSDGSTLVQEIPSQKHFVALEQIHNWLDEAGFVIEQEGDKRNDEQCYYWGKKIR